MGRKSYPRIALGCLGLFVVFCVSYGTQLTTPLKAETAPPPGKGAIDGRLTQHNGEAVKNTTIQLMTAPARGQMPVLVGIVNTDAQGNFKFGSVKPGEYIVEASWLGFGVSKKTTAKKGEFSHVELKLPKVTVRPQAPANP